MKRQGWLTRRLERVANLDEAAICVIPMEARGWAVKGATDASLVEDPRRQVALTVVAPKGPGPCACARHLARKDKFCFAC